MPHALFGQLPANVFVCRLLNRVELMAALVDCPNLIVGRHAGLRVDCRRLYVREVGQAADAHHEELLEVAPENGDEVQALEQRHRLVGALVEDALVECQPR